MPYFEYKKINSNDQLDLKGICLTGCFGNGISYFYNLFKLNGSNTWIPFTTNSYYHSMGISKNDLTIHEELFTDFSMEILWQVELFVYISSRNVSG